MNEIVITATSARGLGGFRRVRVLSELDSMRYATETPMLEVLELLRFPHEVEILSLDIRRAKDIIPNFVEGEDVVLVTIILYDGTKDDYKVELMIEPR